MIKSVKLKNFQKHIDSEISFSEGVNIIIGDSDQGKSSLLRGLRWCLFNDLVGFGFRSWKAKKGDPTFVKIKFNDGDVIRSRTSKENCYEINGQVLKAVRTEVPEEIKNLTKMDQINFQPQHSSYFFIGDSAGEASRKLNEIIGLDIIDKSLQRANSIVKDLNQREGLLKEQIENLNIELKQYETIDDIESLMNDLIIKMDQISKLENEFNQIKHILAKLEILDKSISKLKQFLKTESRVNALEELYEKSLTLNKQITTLNNLINTINILNHKINHLNKTLNKKTFNLVKDYDFLINEINRIRDEYEKLGNLLSSINKFELSAASYSKEIKKLEKLFNDKMRELGICPLCGNKV